MKKILTKKKEEIIIDVADFSIVSIYSWRVDSHGYASTKIKGKYIRMHRLLAGDKSKRILDHINGNKLDNRRENLRLTTYSINALNVFRPPSTNISGLLGVSWDKKKKNWRSQLTFQGKIYFLGNYKDKNVAHAAYCNKKKELLATVAW